MTVSRNPGEKHSQNPVSSLNQGEKPKRAQDRVGEHVQRIVDWQPINSKSDVGVKRRSLNFVNPYFCEIRQDTHFRILWITMIAAGCFFLFPMFQLLYIVASEMSLEAFRQHYSFLFSYTLLGFSAVGCLLLGLGFVLHKVKNKKWILDKTVGTLRHPKFEIPFKKVLGIQVLKKKVIIRYNGNPKSRHYTKNTFASYELNLILPGNLRVNIEDHADMLAVKSDAKVLGKFINCPVYDGTVKKEKIPVN